MGITDLPNIFQVSQGHYSTELATEFCNFGLVHGGYLSAVLCKAATVYFQGEAKLNLPHTFNFHLEFLKPCRPTTAYIDIEPVRKGSGIATVQVTLRQRGEKAITGFITNVDLEKREGLTWPQALKLDPPPRPANIAYFDDDSDENWLPVIFPPGFAKTMNNMCHWKRMVHVDNFSDPSLADHWIAWKYPGAMWTNEWLAHLADNTLGVCENYQPDGGVGVRSFVNYAQKRKSGEWGPDYVPTWTSKYWYPTLNLRLEVKKLLPPDTKWLFMRSQVKKISNGRVGQEILILDKDGDLVAVAHDIVLIKSVEWTGKGKNSELGSGRASEGSTAAANNSGKL